MPRHLQLDRAFDRIDDFLAVQGPALAPDAVRALQEAVDVDDDARAVLRERIAALDRAGHHAQSGAVLLGVLVGLMATDAA